MDKAILTFSILSFVSSATVLVVVCVAGYRLNKEVASTKAKADKTISNLKAALDTMQD